MCSFVLSISLDFRISSFEGIASLFDYLIPFPKALLHMSSGNGKFNVMSSLMSRKGQKLTH